MSTYFNVIEIVNEKTIIVDCGRIAGVEGGDKLRILERGEKVYNPTTEENLGSLDLIKTTVEIVSLYEKFSLCQRINRDQTMNTMLNPLSNFQKNLVRIEQINVDTESTTNRKIRTSSPIKVGDIAELME